MLKHKFVWVVIIGLLLVLGGGAQVMAQTADADDGLNVYGNLTELPEGVFFGMSEAEFLAGGNGETVYRNLYIESAGKVVASDLTATVNYIFTDGQLAIFSYMVKFPDANRETYVNAYNALEALLSERCVKALRELYVYDGNPITRAKACELFLAPEFTDNIRFIKAWPKPYKHYISIGLDAGNPYFIISFMAP